jgi:hypothetical protein
VACIQANTQGRKIMHNYLCFICLMLTLTAACSAPAQAPTKSQLTESEAVDEEEENHEEEDDHEAGDEHREFDSHEHGTAELTIAWIGNEVAIELQTPAFNIVGFEHAPTSEAERELLDESLAALQAGNLLLIRDPEAECNVIEATVHAEMEEEEETAETHDETEAESHSDIEVVYHFQCQQPDRIESLDASELFAYFPNFEQLHAQWVSETEQSAKELTPQDPRLPLRQDG